MEDTHNFFYLVDKPLRSGYLLPIPPLETIFLSLENSLKWIENVFSSLNLDWRINFFKIFFSCLILCSTEHNKQILLLLFLLVFHEVRDI